MALRDLEHLSTDIKAAMQSNGFNTYKFGYLGEINASHNTTYPLILLLPPTSQFNDVSKNDELMTLQFHLFEQEIISLVNDVSMPINQQNSFDLERTFDDLLQRFKGGIHTLVKNNEHKYILTGSWDIERVSQEYNDSLVGLIITIKLSKYTHCLNV